MNRQLAQSDPFRGGSSKPSEKRGKELAAPYRRDQSPLFRKKFFNSVLYAMLALIYPYATWSQDVDPLLDPAARKGFRMLISKETIYEKLREMAQRIDADLAGEELAVLVIMKGAMFVASDLICSLQTPCTVDCIRASSYGALGQRRGELVVSGLSQLDLKGKNVLVVEDIFDSGATLSAVMAELEKMGAKTLRSFVLLTKQVDHVTDYRPDYSLFDIEDHFVIGYGLDYKERWRNLPGIYIAR